MTFRIYRTLLLALTLVAPLATSALAQQWQIVTPSEMHSIPGNSGQFINFPTLSFPAGQRYTVRTSGRVQTQFPKSNDYADAHYYVGILPLPSGVVKVGLQVKTDATNFDYLQAIASSTLSGSSTYSDAVTSTGSSLSFRFFDTEEPPGSKPYYTDNNGAIDVTVLQATAQLVVKDSVLDFGNVDFRSPLALLDSIESFGTEDFKVDRVYITGSSDFSILSAQRGVGAFSLPEMQTNEFKIQFAPTALGPQQAVLHIVSNQAYYPQDRDRTIILKGIGHGPIVTAVPDTTHFGLVGVGLSRTLPVMLSNTGDRDANLTNILIPGATIWNSNDLKPLPAGASTGIRVTFTPPATQYYVAAGVAQIDNGWGIAPFVVDGFGGTGAVATDKDTLYFGQVVVGDKKSLPVTLSNTGSIDVTVSSVGLANSIDFSEIGPGGPYQLTPGSGNVYTVSFSPAALASGGKHVGYLIFNFGNGLPEKQVVLIGEDHAPVHAELWISRKYFSRADSTITVTQELRTKLEGLLDSVLYFSETVGFDANILDLVDVLPGSLLVQPDWGIAKTSITRGEVNIQAATHGRALLGPGELLKFVFKVSKKAKANDFSEFPQTNLSFSKGVEPLMTASPGLLRIRDACGPILMSAESATGVDQSVPNPAVTTTSIGFAVRNEDAPTTYVQLRLYNSIGECVRTLVDAEAVNGSYEVALNTTSLSPGVYTYVFDAGGVHQVRRLLISH